MEGQRRGGARQGWEEREGKAGIAGERGDGNIKIWKYSLLGCCVSTVSHDVDDVNLCLT